MIISSPKDCHISELKALWKEAFGDSDNFINNFFSTAFNKNRCRYAELDSKVVAALYWFECEYFGKKVAYLYSIATAKSHRGKGICSALMEDTHKLLQEIGYEGAILVPGGKELFAFYNKLGYNDVCYIKEFEATSHEKVSLQRIEKSEYQKLRRRHLPQGSVVQENENLDFLAMQAKFYAGEDFILAAHEDEGKFFGTELLGNTEKAGGILAALGYDKAIFRTAGKNKPFALWLPLGNSALPCPKYFGFAFD